ncbi:translation machinery-associated protein 16 [Naganishia albida]|nr:translation machinery-associated protein 16 [Naganishia albida]
MPNNKRHTIKQLQGKGKDKVHPGSRKAGQLDRISLRADKLSHENRMRKTASVTRMERPLYFIGRVTSSTPYTLDAFKDLIANTYLARHAEQHAALVAARRPGRAKDAKLVAIEDLMAREAAEYASGLLVPDLTDGPTCHLIWHWLDNDVRITQAHVDLLRMVRVAPDFTEVVLAREGKPTLLSVEVEAAGAPVTMEVEGV